MPPTAKTTIAARMPRITITMRSSMRVNPPSPELRFRIASWIISVPLSEVGCWFVFLNDRACPHRSVPVHVVHPGPCLLSPPGEVHPVPHDLESAHDFLTFHA